MKILKIDHIGVAVKDAAAALKLFEGLLGLKVQGSETVPEQKVYMNPLPDAKTVLEMISEWFRDYNEYHPHKGLKMKSPMEYRRNRLKLEACPIK